MIKVRPGTVSVIPAVLSQTPIEDETKSQNKNTEKLSVILGTKVSPFVFTDIIPHCPYRREVTQEKYHIPEPIVWKGPSRVQEHVRLSFGCCFVLPLVTGP